MSEGSTSRPKVSIGLPVYNGSRFLAEALEAILAQTYTDFELIVSDNCSTDDTPRIVAGYAAGDHRIRYYRNETNVGAARNFNRAFAHATGEYFKWAADDDLCTPQFLERCVATLDEDPTAVLAHPATQLINPDRSPVAYDAKLGAFVDSHGKSWRWNDPSPVKLTSRDPVERLEYLLLNVVGCTEIFGLIRSSVLRRTGLIGTYYGSDKVLLAELALEGHFRYVAEPLFLRRCHPRQSGYKTTKEREEWISGQRQNGLIFPQRKVLWGYARAVASSRLTPAEKVRSLGAIARYVARPRKLGSLLAPGYSNAFGLEAMNASGALVTPTPLPSKGAQRVAGPRS